MTNNLAATAEAARPGTSDVVSVLRDRSPRLAMAFALGQLLVPTVRKLHSKVRERTTYGVKVTSNDEIYDDLHEWVLSLLDPKDQHALVAWTHNRSELMPISSSSTGRPLSTTPRRVRLRYDGSRLQTVVIAGYRVQVLVDPGQVGRDVDRWRPAEIQFSVRSEAAKAALLDEINNLAARKYAAERQPVFRMLSSWGDWERLDDLPTRDLDSVILPDGQLQRLIADVGRFLGSESEYVRRCVPWHRGHLYEGPPGTGKTSVARAIASHFGMDVWYLPLADVKKDSQLLSVLNRIGPRSMLLLEDADVFHAATQRNDDAGGLTLSGLLNALDGIATPHGLLTVLTTNTPEVLDHAVIRPGRVDVIEHFQLADAEQVGRLMSRWYDQPLAVTPGRSIPWDGISPSEVIEVCKRFDDAEAAVAELTDRTENTRRRRCDDTADR